MQNLLAIISLALLSLVVCKCASQTGAALSGGSSVASWDSDNEYSNYNSNTNSNTNINKNQDSNNNINSANYEYNYNYYGGYYGYNPNNSDNDSDQEPTTTTTTSTTTAPTTKESRGRGLSHGGKYLDRDDRGRQFHHGDHLLGGILTLPARIVGTALNGGIGVHSIGRSGFHR